MTAFLRNPLLGSFAVVAFALFMALPGLGALAPLDRDESRFMQASVQMLETGDYVSISFQDAERNKKPAGSYWSQAASVAFLSEVEARDVVAHRLPSLIGAVLGVFFLYFAARRLIDPDAAFFSAILMAAAPSLAGEATIAKSDALLFGAVALMQFGLAGILRDAWEERGGRSRLSAYAFWIGLGLGALIKGPIAPMIAVFTVGGLSLTNWRAALWRRLHPVSGVLLAGLIVAPWTLLITVQTEGRFISEAMGTDGVAKLTEAQEAHGAPPGLHLLLLPVLFWPALPFLGAGVAAALRGESAVNRGPAAAWLFFWAAPAWVIFEIASTKLPHYVLPLYPALALIAGAFVAAPAPRLGLVRGFSVLYALLGLAFAALLIAIPAEFSSLHDWTSPPLYADIAAGALVLLTLAAAVFAWRGALKASALVAAAAGGLLAWSVLEVTLPAADRLDISRRISAAVDAADLHPRLDGAPAFVSTGYYEPSAVFLFGTKTVLAEPAPAAEAFATLRGAAAVEAREQAAFCAALARTSLRAAPVATLEGFNYSKGREVTITIYAPSTDEGAPGCV